MVYGAGTHEVARRSAIQGMGAAMVSMGYAPDLSSVSGDEDPGLGTSFVSGMNVLYLAMGCLLIAGVVASFLKGPAPAGTGRRRQPVGMQAEG